MISVTPPRRGKTTTNATATGPAKAKQYLHPRIAHLRTYRDLAIPSKYPHTAPPHHLVYVATKPRAGDRLHTRQGGKLGHTTNSQSRRRTASTPLLQQWQGPPATVVAHSKGRPCDDQTCLTTKNSHTSTTRRHRGSPHRTGVTGRSLLARTPIWPSHLSVVTRLTVGSCRRLHSAPPPS